jgi:hypothetical protein
MDMLDNTNDSLNPPIISALLIGGVIVSSICCTASAQITTVGYGTSNAKTQSQRETSANLPSSYRGRSLHSAALRSHTPLVHNRTPVRVNHPWGLTPNDADRANQKRLPETEKLIHNDSLFPGQNRTQAMVLESETGHINPQEDSVLAPKKNSNNQHTGK